MSKKFIYVISTIVILSFCIICIMFYKITTLQTKHPLHARIIVKHQRIRKNSVKYTILPQSQIFREYLLANYIYSISHQPYNLSYNISQKLFHYAKQLHSIQEFNQYTQQYITTLFIAICYVESKFNVMAKAKYNKVNHTRALGLMQICNSTTNAKLLHGISNLYDIDSNLQACIILLQHHYDIARTLLESKKHTKYDIIKKMLNIYSHDNSGTYTINVLHYQKYFMNLLYPKF